MRKALFFTMVWLVLLAAAAWASTMRSIGKDQVNVRSQPNLKSEVLFQAGLGYPVEIQRQQQNWVYFRDWKDNTGWVYKSFLSNTQTVVVLADHANVRKGPSLKTPVVLKAAKGEIFKIFGEQGHWVKIGYYLENDVIGWVRDDLVWGD